MPTSCAAFCCSFRPCPIPWRAGWRAATAWSTSGGTVFKLNGDNFGPKGSAHGVHVSYGPETGTERTATGCAVTTADVEVSCTSVAGVGKDMKFSVSISGQTSALYATSPTDCTEGCRYAAPVIANVVYSGGQRRRLAGPGFGSRRRAPCG